MFVVSYYFSLAEPSQLGQPCGRPGAMRHGRAGHGSPCRSPGVRRCCTDRAGHEGSSLAHPLRCGRWARVSDHGALRLRGLAYRRASSGGWHGRVLWPTSAVLEAGIVAPAGLWCLGSPVLRLHRRVLPVAMSAPPSKGGSTQQGWVHPARVGCPLGQVPAGAWCFGAPVLHPHGRVLPAAVSGPPSKGGRVWSTSKVTSVAACQAAAGVAVWASSQV